MHLIIFTKRFCIMPILLDLFLIFASEIVPNNLLFVCVMVNLDLSDHDLGLIRKSLIHELLTRIDTLSGNEVLSQTFIDGLRHECHDFISVLLKV